MRSIDVSTQVFSLIWSNRGPAEESEDQILLRILSERSIKRGQEPPVVPFDQERLEGEQKMIQSIGVSRHSAWWQVIEAGLKRIGGEGSLSEVYGSVREIALGIGKHVPPSFEAATRGTLEDNSSDSDRWKKVRDVFCMPRGKHTGYWALRKRP